jgi:hypothetical protein
MDTQEINANGTAEQGEMVTRRCAMCGGLFEGVAAAFEIPDCGCRIKSVRVKGSRVSFFRPRTANEAKAIRRAQQGDK